MRLPFPLRHHLQASFPAGGVRPCLPGRVVAIEVARPLLAGSLDGARRLASRIPFSFRALQSVAGSYPGAVLLLLPVTGLRWFFLYGY